MEGSQRERELGKGRNERKGEVVKGGKGSGEGKVRKGRGERRRERKREGIGEKLDHSEVSDE